MITPEDVLRSNRRIMWYTLIVTTCTFVVGGAGFLLLLILERKFNPLSTLVEEKPRVALIMFVILILLCFIGGKMLLEGIRGGEAEEKPGVGLAALLVQGIATSIDALSVGFTIARYRVLEALLCALIIAAVTFVICFAGLQIGKKAGTRLAGKAGILGGAILIFIGIEIFISSLL